MPLRSKHFTEPKRNARLEQCLISDPAHVTRGSSGDHVVLIQQALNKLRDLPGGEDFRLRVSGVYGTETADAVLDFKTTREIVAASRQGAADNVVGKMTIARLDDEMATLERLAAAVVKVNVTPRWGHLVADCDMNGFSRNRLKRNGDSGDWTSSSSKVPIHQMIPMGLTRMLRFEHAGAGTLTVDVDDSTIAMVVDFQHEASRVGTRRSLVTLLGKRPGTTELQVMIDGRRQETVRLPVRERQLVHLNAVYLGPRTVSEDVAGFARGVFSWLNTIVTPQTNILFVPITIRVEPRVSYRGGPPFDIDPSKPLYILKDSDTAPNGAQAVTWDDLRRFHQTTGVSLFYGPNVRSRDDDTIGQSKNGMRMCWAPLRSPSGTKSPQRALVMLGAHEVLHSLGAKHIHTGENYNFLMVPTPIGKSILIPSETLVDI
ncbi:hypothetical protein QO058_00895 [Bosea vestrisii]|uniref:peptidoglycan-binding domain-containing protein n=1 Tax=Bosea vestrisii TaxID=151416 RepID=UPI0024DFC03B|nr:hypothetical protein [Bosea vestrisii]WID96883.1 hypothetical protein QO058_00895 [Bosea vestrisii]